MQPLTAELAGHHLSLPSEPYLALLLLAGLAVVLLGVRGGRMAMGRLDQRPWPVWLWMGWVATGGVVALLLFAGVNTGDVFWALPELHGLVVLCGVLGWLSLASVAVEGWRLFELEEPEGGWRPAHWAELPLLGVLGLSLVLGSLWVRQSWWGVQVPLLAVRGCEEVHQGLGCAPQFRVWVLGQEPIETTSGFLFKKTHLVLPWFTGSERGSSGRSFEDLGGWRIPEQPIPSARLGEVEHEVFAVHGALMVRRRVGPFTVSEDTGDPRMEIRPGATFRYGSTETRSQRVILLKHESHSWDGPALAMQVGDRVQRGGLWAYPVYTREGDEAPTLRGHLQQVDGQSFWLSGEMRAPLFPEVSTEEGAVDTPPPPEPPTEPEAMVEGPPETPELDPPQASLYDSLPPGHEACTVPWMGGVCVCAPAGSLPEQSFAGPIQCAQSHDGAGVGETLFMGFLALVTLGLTPGVPHERTETLLLSAGQEPLWDVNSP